MPMLMPILMAIYITFNYSFMTVPSQEWNISLCIAAVPYIEQEIHDLKLFYDPFPSHI